MNFSCGVYPFDAVMEGVSIISPSNGVIFDDLMKESRGMCRFDHDRDAVAPGLFKNISSVVYSSVDRLVKVLAFVLSGGPRLVLGSLATASCSVYPFGKCQLAVVFFLSSLASDSIRCNDHIMMMNNNNEGKISQFRNSRGVFERYLILERLITRRMPLTLFYRLTSSSSTLSPKLSESESVNRGSSSVKFPVDLVFGSP